MFRNIFKLIISKKYYSYLYTEKNGDKKKFTNYYAVDQT